MFGKGGKANWHDVNGRRVRVRGGYGGFIRLNETNNFKLEHPHTLCETKAGVNVYLIVDLGE